MPITRIKQIFLHLAWTSPSSFEGLDKYLGRLDTIMNGDFKELWERNTDTSERRFSLLKSIEFRSHCSFPLKFSISLCLLKWLQCSEFKWTQLGPKLQLNLNVITNRSLRLPQVSFHFRTSLSDRFRWAIMKCANKLSGKTRVTESSLLNIQSPIDYRSGRQTRHVGSDRIVFPLWFSL